MSKCPHCEAKEVTYQRSAEQGYHVIRILWACGTKSLQVGGWSELTKTKKCKAGRKEEHKVKRKPKKKK